MRENTEGPYAGEGGVLATAPPHEVATQGSVNTRFGVERCVRYAFARASQLERKNLTLVHKTNVLTFAGDLWRRVVAEVGAEFPEVVVDYQHVDAACIYFVERPQALWDHRHRQSLRRHPLGPGGCGHGRDRFRREREFESGAHRGVAL